MEITEQYVWGKQRDSKGMLSYEAPKKVLPALGQHAKNVDVKDGLNAIRRGGSDESAVVVGSTGVQLDNPAQKGCATFTWTIRKSKANDSLGIYVGVADSQTDFLSDSWGKAWAMGCHSGNVRARSPARLCAPCLVPRAWPEPTRLAGAHAPGRSRRAHLPPAPNPTQHGRHSPPTKPLSTNFLHSPSQLFEWTNARGAGSLIYGGLPGSDESLAAGSTVTVKVDLAASPRTLAFSVNGGDFIQAEGCELPASVRPFCKLAGFDGDAVALTYEDVVSRTASLDSPPKEEVGMLAGGLKEMWNRLERITPDSITSYLA
jgi:hypothetical protein